MFTYSCIRNTDWEARTQKQRNIKCERKTKFPKVIFKLFGRKRIDNAMKKTKKEQKTNINIQ